MSWNHTHEVSIECFSLSSEHSAQCTLMKSTLNGDIAKYEDECPLKRAKGCFGCPQSSVECRIVAMSALNHPDGPFIDIVVLPTCGTAKCSGEIVAYLSCVTREAGMPMVNSYNMEVCWLCGKEDGLLRCAKCKEIWHCSTYPHRVLSISILDRG